MKILSLSSHSARQEWMKTFEEQAHVESVQFLSGEGTLEETLALIPFQEVDMVVLDFRFPHFFGDDLGYQIEQKVPEFPFILLTDEEDAVFDRTPLMSIPRIIPMMDDSPETLTARFVRYIRYYKRLVEEREKEYHEMMGKFKESPTAHLESEINSRVRFLNSVPTRTEKLEKLDYGTPMLDKLILKMEQLSGELKQK